MEEKSMLLGFLGNRPFTRVIDFLMENKGFDYSKKEIAKGASVSWGSLFNIWPRLERYGIVRPTRRYGNTTLYALNAKSPIVKNLTEMELHLISSTSPKPAPAIAGA
jgi:predicted AAA+ superfamily ATPase